MNPISVYIKVRVSQLTPPILLRSHEGASEARAVQDRSPKLSGAVEPVALRMIMPRST